MSALPNQRNETTRGHRVDGRMYSVLSRCVHRKLKVHGENVAFIVNTLKRVKSWPDNESVQYHMRGKPESSQDRQIL